MRKVYLSIVSLVVLMSLFLTGCKEETKTTPDMDKINEVKDKVETEKEDTYSKVTTELIKMFKDANVAYSESLEKLNKEDNEVNQKAYSDAWGQLTGITNYFDSNMDVFPNETRLKANDLLLEIDKIMEEKKDPKLVDEKILEMEAVFKNQVQK